MSQGSGRSARLSRPVVGAMVLVGLVVALQVPIALIRELIRERVATRDGAVADVGATWGGAQSIVGPRLVVPYRVVREAGVEAGVVSLLPASLTVEGEVDARPLERGLFTIPVYEAALRIEGEMEAPDLAGLGLAPADLSWREARLVVEVSDPKAIGSGSSLVWDGRPAQLLPGTGATDDRPGIHAAVATTVGAPTAFRLVLDVNGANELWVVPFARDTRVHIRSNWPHPGFSGAWLPTERDVRADGFTASWRVPFLGRDYPQSWTGAEPREAIDRSRFGVTLVTPIDTYRMSERSTKYSTLFLTLTFGLLWLFDVLTGIRVHPIQYLLVGAAMCLFYLLELSLGEHLGFVPAYVVAALAVAVLVAAYTREVLHSPIRGAAIGGALGLLYAYLLALLSLERYALLAGSLGLFALLAATMHLTRRIDWHQIGRTSRPGPLATEA